MGLFSGLFPNLFSWLYSSKLTCRKCRRKNAYKLVKEKLGEAHDEYGFLRKWKTKWRCRYCGHEEIDEQVEHVNYEDY